MRRIGFVGVAAIAGMVLAAPAEGALECGDTVTGDRKLTQDLVDCPDGGLVVQDNGVTLDMNGHEIRGANDYGIEMLGAKNVTIKNGAIRNNLSTGIYAVNTNRLTLNNLDVINPGNRGIQVIQSNGVTIKKSVVRKAPNDAFFFTQLNNATATNVAVAKGDGTGFDISDVDGLTVEDSSVEGDDVTSSGGISVVGTSEGSEFRDMEIEDWGDVGLELDATGTGNVIDDVTSTDNEYGFSIGAGEAKVRNSVASGNGDDGLLVNGLDAVRVTKGRFNGNGDEGIQFQASTTGAVGDNVANNNVDTGILLPATGVTDLGGNSATGNGVANCVNVSC